MSRMTQLIFVILMLAAAGISAAAHAKAPYETPPVLKASDLAPPMMLKGPRFTVDEAAPTTDLLTRFIIRSDFGVFEAHGRDQLAIRVVEVGALDQLEKTSKTDEFVNAVKNAALRPVTSAVNMAQHPVDTVKGAPAAVGRFFDRVQLGAKNLAKSSKSSETTAQKVGETTQRVGSVAADALGYESERRALAKRLGVDPYTTNHVLSAKLDEMAWYAFSGRLGVNIVETVVVPFSLALSATSITNDMIWDTKPADLLNLDNAKLRTMGAADADVQALMGNPWYSISTLTALVDGLDKLNGVNGRDQVIAFAASAPSEDRAQLVLGQVQMLAREQAATGAIVQLEAPGPLVARMRNGAILIPVPFDYLPWLERVSTFAQRPDLRTKNRTIWLTGTFSPRARQELTALGWKLRENPTR